MSPDSRDSVSYHTLPSLESRSCPQMTPFNFPDHNLPLKHSCSCFPSRPKCWGCPCLPCFFFISLIFANLFPVPSAVCSSFFPHIVPDIMISKYFNWFIFLWSFFFCGSGETFQCNCRLEGDRSEFVSGSSMLFCGRTHSLVTKTSKS